VNGTDKASEIATLAEGFLRALQAAPPIPAPTPATDDKRPWWLSLLAAIGRLILDAIQRLRT
jgi:hypothetical protein